MSIEDDVILLDRVPTIHLLGNAAIRMLAIGSEQQEFARGSVLFRAGDEADCGYVVQSGGFRVSFGDSARHDVTAGPGSLIGELALIVAMKRPATATALEYSSIPSDFRSPIPMPRFGCATISPIAQGRPPAISCWSVRG